ncbi:hypothetical protein L596_010267 [Steinernema carpocapsae]|uniref:Uncharacterized protein n=1 Tax=Steinernema carpocapsae TaxID=34508 RepID=A0A4U5PHU3_STECR|nr:hypothetical protein L596_010267 [Steinernema carpocapsae]
MSQKRGVEYRCLLRPLSRTKSKSSKASKVFSPPDSKTMTQYANEDTSSMSSEVAYDERLVLRSAERLYVFS